MTPNELADAVATHRARLLSSFRGGEEPWADVRESYGVGPGATRDVELRACLEAVVAWGREAARDGGDEALGAHLAALVRETMGEVAPAPTTGAKAGLAMIFANATASTGWWKQRYGRVKSVYVARCRRCGARQTVALQFHCVYCGQFLYDDPKAIPGSDEER